ncbi:MAG TPA: efflux RND transporter permease subunit [Chitinophagaceae bacterium]|nr:efflux RND transporter permease subunit [Chitinophagaceae bacterium]
MWKRLAQFILNNRILLLIILLGVTAFMAYKAKKLELSYEFANAIPTDHPKYKSYQEFRKKFGEDGNLLVIGIQTDKIFEKEIFNDYKSLSQQLKKAAKVEDVMALTTAINLTRDPDSENLETKLIFRDTILEQNEIDSCKDIFFNLPFYRHLLYNPETKAWLMGIRIDKEVLATKKREKVVRDISSLANDFGKKHQLEIHLSGLPLIRTVLAKRIADEMQWFLLASVLLFAIILLLFFRSVSAMLLSLSVVMIGVIWSLGTMVLLGYKITLLTALIPPLVVVIGIPNCIYFLNKFHVSFNETGNKKEALLKMVDRMGIVTLFCNIAAAIGFAVFALTQSQILKEFGAVAGINIMLLFLISLILIPSVLSFLPTPKNRHTKYLVNPRLNRWLARLERWSLNNRKFIYTTTILIAIVSITGMSRLRSEGFIVDDLPKTDKIYTDLKFFEKNFKGVMPLEIVVDTKKKRGVSRNLNNLIKIDSLAQFLASMPDIGKPLTIIEGLKFAKQAFFEGDSLNYSIPTERDMIPLKPYLEFKEDSIKSNNSFARIVSTFTDEDKQQARISVSMRDVGSYRLPLILDSIQKRVDTLFDKDKYNVQLTGASVTFLEGSSFIIHGLKESILWAFGLIALCMLYLFRSWRILLCSLIPNMIPLLITAGVMGWLGVRIKPSTVLIFSVALGIAIDVTIRFLVNYKQELPRHNFDIKKTVIATIHSTGISIIYTSMVLIAGFIIFCFSGFGGTQSLGWLTSLTLVTATVTNLVLLPALLITLNSKKKK